MNIALYMSFIPGIISGIALTGLLKIFKHKDRYWEVSLLAFLFVLQIVVDRYRLFLYPDELYINPFYFTIFLFSPLIYMYGCNILVPDATDKVVKDYFMDVKKKLFIAVGLYIIMNLILSLVIAHDFDNLYMRIAGLVLLALAAYVDKLWVRVILYVIWIAGITQLFYMTYLKLNVPL